MEFVMLTGFVGLVLIVVSGYVFYRVGIERASAGARAAIDAATARMKEASGLADDFHKEAEHWERRFYESQDVVEVYQRQRDEYKRLFKEQSVRHLNGQQQLETNLVAARTIVQRLTKAINEERRARDPNAEPFRMKDVDPIGSPVGVAKTYFEEMLALVRGAPAELDAELAKKRVLEEDFDDALARAIVEARRADQRPLEGLPLQRKRYESSIRRRTVPQSPRAGGET